MRARNLKPSFFVNSKLAECDPLSRILFQGLWCMADRRGRLEDDPKKIKVCVLPYDNGDVSTMLDQLQHHAFILRYKAKGNNYIQIINFDKHQHPHIKESESTIPAPDKHHTRLVQKRPLIDSPFPLPESPLLVSAGAQPYALPDPKTDPKKCLVLSYKSRKGVAYDNRAWDKTNFSRCIKAAGPLLELCGDLAVAQTCLDALGSEYDDKGLTWTLETVARNAAEWMKKTGRIDANASRAGLRLAIAERRSKERDQEGLVKASEGSLHSALRDGSNPQDRAEANGQ